MGRSGSRVRGLASSRQGPRAREGFSLVEVLITMVVLAVGLGAALSSFLGSSALSRSSRQRDTALDAAHSVLEMIEAERFDWAFATFDADGADDPSAFAIPAAFSVEGLDPLPGDPDGLVGEVLFPGDGVELREDVVDKELGMPRDLNGDGAIDALNHAADYIVLPVRVRVVWKGETGEQLVELVTTVNEG